MQYFNPFTIDFASIFALKYVYCLLS